MGRLFLLRHGQSVYNLENRFTGFEDVPLSKTGEREALEAGLALKAEKIDVLFVSALKRAVHTADIVLDVLSLKELPRIGSKALNERHYGSLQGLNKDEVREKYGAEQVHIWRRSYDIPPPGGESLKQTCERVVPYFKAEILPRLVAGENVLVVAHGNSLRGLIMELEGLSAERIIGLEIPTGVPISYDIDTNGVAGNKRKYGSKEIS